MGPPIEERGREWPKGRLDDMGVGLFSGFVDFHCRQPEFVSLEFMLELRMPCRKRYEMLPKALRSCTPAQVLQLRAGKSVAVLSNLILSSVLVSKQARRGRNRCQDESTAN